MKMRIKKSVCVGLDVHKNNVWACVCLKDPDSEKDTLIFKSKKFPSNHTDLCAMCNWAESIVAKKLGDDFSEPIEVYMESTGKYSTPVYNVCEECGLIPHIVNPKHVRTIAGQKTDQKDCAWIAELGINGLLRSSYIPPADIRSARRLSRARTKILHARQDDVRRAQNILTEANIRMDLIFSGVDGESARKVIDYLLETDEPDLEIVKGKIRRSCRIMTFRTNEERKEKEEELLKAFDGAKFSPSQKFELRSTYLRIDNSNKQIRSYEDMMEETLGDYKEELKLIQSVPGFSRLSAMQVLAEIGPDMKQFGNSKNFISWCGLCPASNQSNSKHKSVKCGKGGRYLKPVLIQCALNAVHDPYYEGKYKAISARRGKKRALIAIARKMMVAVYHMLLNGEYFHPTIPAEELNPDIDDDDMNQYIADTEESYRQAEIQKTAAELIALTDDKDLELKNKIQQLLSQLGLQEIAVLNP